ncbi:ATP-binding protein [Streptomyces sp. NPDC047049]|uniref:ATP-binding protein n=1 Tax=Streptomyces sp. NPDC047049 TaxID=3156688 RepID=UPI0033CD76DC
MRGHRARPSGLAAARSHTAFEGVGPGASGRHGGAGVQGLTALRPAAATVNRGTEPGPLDNAQDALADFGWVSESGLNALKYHGSRLIAVALSRTAETACIGVSDEGRGYASVPLPPGPEQEGGRGLLIVEALADRWGQRKLDCGGFTVWAEMALKR